MDDNIIFTVNQYSLPTFWPYPVSCDHKCDITIDQFLYIIQHDGETPFILIYDMADNSFIETNYNESVAMWDRANFPFPWDDPGDDLINGCIVHYNRQIFILSGKNILYYQSEVLANGFVYDIQRDFWVVVVYQLTTPVRKGIGCAIYNSGMYLFGGETYETQREVSYIEKCDLSSVYAYARMPCEPVIGSMTYPRSYHQIAVTQHNYFLYERNKRTYFIIYGGMSMETRNHIEIFVPETEQMMQSIPFDTNGLNVDKYSSLLFNDYLLILGGVDIENNSEIMSTIKYIDTSLFFVNSNDPYNYQCKTMYDASESHVSIDDYLWQNPEFGIKFHLNEANIGEITVKYDETKQIDILLKRHNDKVSAYEIKGYDKSDVMLSFTREVVTNMSMVSELTNIDMVYPNSAFWMKWSVYRDQNGNALSIPYWRMGFGDISDKYNFNDFGCSGSWFHGFKCDTHELENVFIGDVYEIIIYGGKYTFYTDACTLNLHITTSNFSVGGFLLFMWDIHQATSLNIPIYITSDDIVGINHTIYILENNNCLIYSKNGSYVECDNGIKITDLKQYNIDQNEYKIHISSGLNDLQISHTILSRNVMNVEIIIELSNGLFPNSEIQIIPSFDASKPTQPNGTILIYFDEDLMFKNNMAKMLIDFENNLCTIEYNDINIACDESIIIPSNIILKSVSNNHYLINIQSNDINLIGEHTFSFARKMQNLRFSFSESIFLGKRIAINYDIIDDQLYQGTSSIIITSLTYGIASIVTLKYYDINTTFCEIETMSTKATELCDNGFRIQTSDSASIGNYINIRLSSIDTYLKTYNASILIEHCPSGQGLIGSDSSSYSCSQCPHNQVGISDSECISCEDISGISCSNSSNLLISYNYWINIEDQKILTNFCPVGYCCQNIDGCNYLKTINASLCAENRDSNIPICGGCVEGYSNVFGSTNCKICKENNYYLLLIPFLIAFLFVGIFIALDVPEKEKEKEENIDDKLEIIQTKDGQQAMQISFLKPIIYYFQAISFVTIQTGYTFYLTPITQLFAFDFSVSETVGIANEIDGICFTKNMKSMDKQLWGLFLPFCYFISIFIYWIINKLIKNVCKKHILLFDFGAEVVWRIFLINIGIIVFKMLKLLACSTIGSNTVHFYAGNISCFGSIWYFALISICFVVLFWFIMLLLLFRISIKNKSTETVASNSYSNKLTKPYHSTHWYWEIVLISRRIIISSLVTFQYISFSVIQYILLIILIIYLCLQIKIYPFKQNTANIMDCLCMFLLIICLITLSNANILHEQYVSIIMVFVVLIPLILLLIYIIVAVIHCRKVTKDRKQRIIDAKSATNTENTKRNCQSGLTKETNNGTKASSVYSIGHNCKETNEVEIVEINAELTGIKSMIKAHECSESRSNTILHELFNNINNDSDSSN